MPAVLCFGEILMDLLPLNSHNQTYFPIPGGAPANVAVGIAKLAGRAAFMGSVGDDDFAVQLRNALQQYGVDTRYLVTIANSQTALAIVAITEVGERSFHFYRHKTADLLLTEAALPEIDWYSHQGFHFGSNMLTNPSSFALTKALLSKAKVSGLLTSFDVNLRPRLWPNSEIDLSRIERCITHSAVVKCSAEELAVLAKLAGEPVESYLQRLFTLGAQLILVTDGAKPVRAITRGFTLTMMPPQVAVVDTTAAGDSFMAGFLTAFFSAAKSLTRSPAAKPLWQLDLENPELLLPVLAEAICCGAWTCMQKGAFPAMPNREALTGFRQQLPEALHCEIQYHSEIR